MKLDSMSGTSERPVARPRSWDRGRSAASCVGAGIVMVALAGCRGPTDPPPGVGGSIEHRSALVVSGSVMDPSGSAIFGSTVRVTVFEYQNGCSTDALGPPFEGMVNEVGEYSLNLTFDRNEFDACLTIEAIPPQETGFQPQVEQAVDLDVNELGDGIRTVEFHFVLRS